MTKLGTVDGGIDSIGGKRLKDLDYAGEICLFAKDIDSMKAMKKIVVAEASKVGLKINTKETEIMKICCTKSQSVTTNCSNLQEVEKFICLGSDIKQVGDVRNKVGIRLGKSESSFRLLQKVWNAHNVTLPTKFKRFNSIVISVLIYGCESWRGLKEVGNRVRRFESRYVRKFLNI